MRIIYQLYLITSITVIVTTSEKQSNEQLSNLFEDDIILLPHQLEIRHHKKLFYWRNNNQQQLWPNKTLYYEYAPGEFNDQQKYTIEAAIANLKENTCVKFKKRDSSTTTYIYFRNKPIGCASSVGYYPVAGPLMIFLEASRCHTTGTVQHELLHALGFWHEHNRYDRDNYIKVLWNNIIPGREYDFAKKTKQESNTLEMPYDYGSVMHYRSLAFSKDEHSPTIIPHDIRARNVIGQRIRFSKSDLAKLNRLYNCSPLYYYTGDDIVKNNFVGNYLKK